MRRALPRAAGVLLLFGLAWSVQGQATGAYKAVEGWPRVPDGVKFGAGSGVAIDSEGDIYVFHRGEPPILVFHPDGQLVRSFGDGLFKSAHGLRIDPDENIWVTDNADHTVTKFRHDGKVLMHLGEKGVAGEDPKHFNKPTDIAFAPNGDFFISDGYGNSRVVKFDKDGRFIRAWGTKGQGKGEFNLPHAVRLDSKGKLYVGDRENNRIQVFEQDGTYIREITGIAPFGLFITPTDELFVADGRANRITKMTLDGKVLARFGSEGARPGDFRLPHGITVAKDGAVYVTEIDGKRIQKFVPVAAAAQAPVRNSIGMDLVELPAGQFEMGSRDGEWDEAPVHTVKLAKPLLISATEVTNAQYEQFDPEHRELRGKRGLSKEDDEAVIFVSWEQATKFCEWLSKKEGATYRLPTEAEWEYACRAGTKSPYSTGDDLPDTVKKNQREEWDPKPIPLHVAKTPPNAWGLYDMHGNVEEWCSDWYGPYDAADQTDPVGRESGEFRVTRGGSHSTLLKFLRSANRSAALPEDKHWLIGFRVVRGERPSTKPRPPVEKPRWARDVAQEQFDWLAPKPGPYFAEPIRFVKIPEGSNGPLYAKHNHCPDITWCANGDLLAAWYSTNTEPGRELTAVAARLRKGATEWEPADVFYKAADRNMHATALWFDGKTIYHFNGVSTGHGWGQLALFVRTSTDNGATWSAPIWIDREHEHRNQAIHGVFRTKAGVIVFPCDATPDGNGGTAIHVSRDGGKTWDDPGLKTDPVQPAKYLPGIKGGTIAGIHAGAVELADGKLMAFGRGDSIDGKMPMSISADEGKSWSYSASEFPPLTGGQRLVLMRLDEGPILFCSFTGPAGMDFVDAGGKVFRGFGLYAALSTDEGTTWPVRKLLTPGEGKYDGGAWTKEFKSDATHAEPKGYLAATQSPDGVIHLISSALHYRFNRAWLEQRPDASKPGAPAQ